MYVCVCHAVTDHAIRDAVVAGARTLDDLTMRTGLGGTCGSCRELAQEILEATVEPAARVEITRPDV